MFIAPKPILWRVERVRPIGAGIFKPRIDEKRWNRSEELRLIEVWEKERQHLFNYDVSDPRPVIVFDTPPPYASGPWHVGGAAHYAQIDMVGRYFRMRGYNVLLPFYADRNGLPVEVQVEKKTGVNPHEVAATPEGRERFLKMCSEELDRVEEMLVRTWKRLGCSFEYWRDGTDSPEYRRITQATFIELWRRGLIYEAERPVNWCPRCRTTLADAELEYYERGANLYYIKFRVAETGEDIVIATTRPELLNGCAAVIYNPEDERYKRLRGLHAVIPIYERRVPIVERPEARPDFGTGLVMICSYGDQTDIRLFREMGLEPRILIDKGGRMNGNAGFLEGLTVGEARERIAEELERRGLLVRVERVSHEIPVCWRCKTPVEFIHSKEYFMKQVEFKEQLKEVSSQMIFYPEEHRRRLYDWIDSITTDWPISRDRYYATEVPVWRCEECGSLLVPEPGRYYRPWIDPPPFEKCPYCGAPSSRLRGETKVFDTWFDSSVSVLYVTGYLRRPELFKKLFGYAVRPQGYDIVRTWLYYAVLRVYLLIGRPPFRWVRITGMGLDERGEAMHKSKGNVIDPMPYVEKYGADAFRFWAAAASKLGSDYRFSEQLIKTGMLFVTKLWNIGRFISAFPEPDPSEASLRPLDRAMLGALNELLRKCISAYDGMDVFVPINEVYQFTWNIFASHYLEAVKLRAYNRGSRYGEGEQKAAWYVLHTVFKNVLRLLAPIMPFVTDAIWRRLYSEAGVHVERIPDPPPEWEYPKDLLERLMEADRAVWSYKKRLGLTPGKPLDMVLIVSEEYRDIMEELRDMHKLREVRVGGPEEGAEEIGPGLWVA